MTIWSSQIVKYLWTQPGTGSIVDVAIDSNSGIFQKNIYLLVFSSPH